MGRTTCLYEAGLTAVSKNAILALRQESDPVRRNSRSSLMFYILEEFKEAKERQREGGLP